MLNGYLREVSKVFQESLIEGCSESPFRVIQVTFKVSKRSSNCVSRQFQRYFKEDSRVLKKVSSVFQENCIKSFKGFSRISQ